VTAFNHTTDIVYFIITLLQLLFIDFDYYSDCNSRIKFIIPYCIAVIECDFDIFFSFSWPWPISSRSIRVKFNALLMHLILTQHHLFWRQSQKKYINCWPSFQPNVIIMQINFSFDIT